MRNKLLLFAFTFLTLLYFQAPLQAQSQTQLLDEIKKNLSCQCGCQMTIAACAGSMNCMFADNLTEEIKQFLQSGMSKDEILARYVSQYGELILAAPTKKGFNLVAWILPFVVIIVAGFFIVKVLQYWVRLDRGYKKYSADPDAELINQVYKKKLDKILDTLD